MPDFELIIFSASEAYKANPAESIKPVVEWIKNVEGLLSFQHGLQVEDNKLGYLFLGWVSIERHKAMMEAESYKEIISLLGKHVLAPGAGIDMQHVTYADLLEGVVSAPVTEIAIFKRKEGKTNDEVLKLWSEVFQPTIRSMEGHHAEALGPSIENEGTFVLTVGWESVEAHNVAIADENYQAKGAIMFGVVDLVGYGHVKILKEI
ncbi:uncharacterized protein BT62DRAFT_937645 [Guyanagaster necrorhizus]|uniref:ABM domain-containing protein n=1 Tax=Guyanagaster necrorhizus TaxID=856835 RepID=A0A9P7VI99_9AGAR|nr:uncharacterized protein BT62DRAFT_937645 [Guyanagaster necrorhizus MCA 3950]KAG7440865.1 hypothetical protein BT62DRAFT_937645 [Guyanagaster necrorhizus MCA 3950]